MQTYFQLPCRQCGAHTGANGSTTTTATSINESILQPGSPVAPKNSRGNSILLRLKSLVMVEKFLMATPHTNIQLIGAPPGLLLASVMLSRPWGSKSFPLSV